jgi:hypothetical protein
MRAVNSEQLLVYTIQSTKEAYYTYSNTVIALTVATADNTQLRQIETTNHWRLRLFNCFCWMHLMSRHKRGITLTKHKQMAAVHFIYVCRRCSCIYCDLK